MSQQDDFFQDQTATEETPVEKIKVGDEEFTPEELQRYVGLGKIGAEAETKYKTKIDRVWPNYQQVINEKRDLEAKTAEYQKKIDELQGQVTQYRPKEVPLTPEQTRAEAIRAAEELGIGPNAIRQQVINVVQANRLIDDIGHVIDEMTEQGLPSTTVDDVIKHMQDEGIKNPEKAYKDMFEKEWLDMQAKKLAEIKPKGLNSIATSVAGSKTPEPVRITKDNLDQMVAEALGGV